MRLMHYFWQREAKEPRPRWISEARWRAMAKQAQAAYDAARPSEKYAK